MRPDDLNHDLEQCQTAGCSRGFKLGADCVDVVQVAAIQFALKQRTASSKPRLTREHSLFVQRKTKPSGVPNPQREMSLNASKLRHCTPVTDMPRSRLGEVTLARSST